MSGGRQTHSRGRKPPVWGKENRSPEAPERTRRQRGPTESVALNMTCAHIRSRRSWLRAYALALICRPSASSAAPQALQGSLSFSCVTGGSPLRLRLDEPPPAICLSSSGLKNSARLRLAGGDDKLLFISQFLIQNGNLLPPTVPPAGAGSIFFFPSTSGFRLRLSLRRDRQSFARLRLAGEAEFISRLVLRALSAGGKLC